MHVIHEDQSLAIVPLSTDNMTDIGLPHASYNQGTTLIQQHPQAITTSNGWQQDLRIRSSTAVSCFDGITTGHPRIAPMPRKKVSCIVVRRHQLCQCTHLLVSYLLTVHDGKPQTTSEFCRKTSTNKHFVEPMTTTLHLRKQKASVS